MLVITIDNPRALVECRNCGWTGQAASVRPIEDAGMRLTAGEIVPAGQCPCCDALAYLAERDTARYVVRQGGLYLRKCDAQDEYWTTQREWALVFRSEEAAQNVMALTKYQYVERVI